LTSSPLYPPLQTVTSEEAVDILFGEGEIFLMKSFPSIPLLYESWGEELLERGLRPLSPILPSPA
jgi:hypothetical protein